MGRLLLAHLLVGRAILVRGAVLPPSFDPRRQPQFCWINKDGLPFTMPQWQAEFSLALTLNAPSQPGLSVCCRAGRSAGLCTCRGHPADAAMPIVCRNRRWDGPRRLARRNPTRRQSARLHC